MFENVHLIAPTIGVYFAAFLACVLLVLSGFASGSEIAFFSLSPSDINELEESRQDADQHILDLREDSERTLATILITNNLVNVTIIMLCNYVFAQIIDFGDAYWLQFICLTVLLTFILLLFGEIMPKVFSSQQPLKFCRRAVAGIKFCRKIFYPFATILLRSGILASKVVQKENKVLSVDDLEQALELTDKEDIKDEKNMLEGIVRFGDETAKEVMTSRQDLEDLDIKTSFRKVLEFVVQMGYSRVPVYAGTEDNIKGILYIKDLLPYIDKPDTFRWQSLLRPAYFVPETKKIDDLLEEFRTNKIHMAIVVDEFGGTSGIVTMEDILEEIVGEISDEYDEDEKQYIRLSDGSWIFEAKILLTDFFRVIDVDPAEFGKLTEEVETLAGLLLEIKGDFPRRREIIDYNHYRFQVLEVDNRRILKVKFNSLPVEPQPEEKA